MERIDFYTRISGKMTVLAPVAPLFLLNNLTAVPVGAFSFRKLREAYAGSAVRIRATGDNAETDIGFDGDDFDTAAVAAFLITHGGSACITTWYDQSVGGSNNLVQATAGNQPTYSATDMNSLPTLQFSNDYLRKTSFSTGGGAPLAVCAVINTDSSAANGRIAAYRASGDTNEGTFATSAHIMSSFVVGIYAYRNSIARSSVTMSGNETVASVFDGTNHTMYGNNVAGTPVASTETFGATGTFTVGADASNADLWTGNLSEYLIFTSALSSGDRTTIHTSQDAYWL